MVLSADAQRQREEQLQERYVELQNKLLMFQQELTKKEAQLMQEIFQKAAKVIEAIAKRDAITMVLEKSESAVLYADPATDITAEVNRRLDAGEGK